MPSLAELLRWLHPLDFAVLGHGWVRHGRDCLIVVQDMLGSDPGTHELTDWSNAYPGLSIPDQSDLADHWTQRLGKEMAEVGLETDRFLLRLIFHSVLWRKLDDDVGTISQVHIPLRPPANGAAGAGGPYT